MRIIQSYKTLQPTFGKRRALSLATLDALSSDIEVTPVFIIGCGHSGTSLVNKILSTHPSIWAVGGETRVFEKHQDDKTIAAHLKSWTILAKTNKKTHFVEKTPSHVHFIDKLQHHCPRGKIIGVVRNPLDTVASLYQRNRNLQESINRYKNDTSTLISAINNIHVVNLESIVDDFENALLRTQDYIKVHREDLSKYYENKTYFDAQEIRRPLGHSGKEHSAKRNFQVNQPIFDSRGKWKSLLSKSEAEKVTKELNHLAVQLGY